MAIVGGNIMKGQAALDFLMTYGWALLLIALVAAALLALGILDSGSFMGSRAVGFSQVSPTGWSFDSSGAFKLKLKNNAGSNIIVTSITATYGQETAVFAPPVDLANLTYGAESGVLNVGTFGVDKPGASYTMRVNINYTDSEAGFPYNDAGTVTGKIV
jgi:hypothetical protein